MHPQSSDDLLRELETARKEPRFLDAATSELNRIKECLAESGIQVCQSQLHRPGVVVSRRSQVWNGRLVGVKQHGVPIPALLYGCYHALHLLFDQRG